jgi:hypothetical protein
MSEPDTFDPSLLPPSYFDERIRTLDRRVKTLTAELHTVEEQLVWWRNGRKLFATERDEDVALSDEQHAVDPNSRTTDLPAPQPPHNGSGQPKPTVRRAVLRIMLNRPPINGEEVVWRASEVITEVERCGWLPNGKNAANVVRRMLRELSTEGGPLLKPGYGLFQLAPSTRDGEMAVGSVP